MKVSKVCAICKRVEYTGGLDYYGFWICPECCDKLRTVIKDVLTTDKDISIMKTHE
jgi:hypothetical protein